MKLDIVCSEHKKYQAKREPMFRKDGTFCEACQILYSLKQGALTGVKFEMACTPAYSLEPKS